MILKANVKYSRMATGPTKISTTNLALILSPLLANSLVCIARTRYAWKLDEMRPRVSHRNSSLYEISKCLPISSLLHITSILSLPRTRRPKNQNELG